MNATIDYRFVGNMIEWCCKRCGSVMQSSHVPAIGEEHCSSCQLTLALAGATLASVDLTKERDEWQRRAIAAERQCEALISEIHELRDSAAKAMGAS